MTPTEKRRYLLALAKLYERSAQKHERSSHCYRRKIRKARECRQMAEKLLDA
jgi:hypothetical protein